MAEETSHSSRPFSTFIWDSENMEIFGQRRSTFLKVLVGLLILVVVVVAIAVSIVLTRETEVRPGMSFQPNLGNNMIRYRVGRKEEEDKYTKVLKSIVDEYALGRTGLTLRDCSLFDPPSENEDTVCVFYPERFHSVCSEVENFGYPRNKICIFLTPNQVPGWVPQPYENFDELPEEMPQQLLNSIRNLTQQHQGKFPKMAWVSCRGLNPADEEFLWGIEYGPYQGFPLSYFPYQEKLKNFYQPPIVAIAVKLRYNVVVAMECRLWAKNLEYTFGDGASSIVIEMIMD